MDIAKGFAGRVAGNEFYIAYTFGNGDSGPAASDTLNGIDTRLGNDVTVADNNGIPSRFYYS